MEQESAEVQYPAPEVKLRKFQAGKTSSWYRGRHTEGSVSKHKGEERRVDARVLDSPWLLRGRNRS
jgi:hypothetical protein